MAETNLHHLAHCIRNARKACDLTQQELAAQTGLAVKTIQDIEAGRINPTYETLCRMMNRLGITANTIFKFSSDIDEETYQLFLGKFQSCSRENQKILLDTVIFLTECLLRQQQTEPSQD